MTIKIPKFNVALYFAEKDKNQKEINYEYQVIFKITDFKCPKEEKIKITQVVKSIMALDYARLQEVITNKSYGICPFVSFEVLSEIYNTHKKILISLVRDNVVVLSDGKWFLKEGEFIPPFTSAFTAEDIN